MPRVSIILLDNFHFGFHSKENRVFLSLSLSLSLSLFPRLPGEAGGFSWTVELCDWVVGVLDCWDVGVLFAIILLGGGV